MQRPQAAPFSSISSPFLPGASRVKIGSHSFRSIVPNRAASSSSSCTSSLPRPTHFGAALFPRSGAAANSRKVGRGRGRGGGVCGFCGEWGVWVFEKGSSPPLMPKEAKQPPPLLRLAENYAPAAPNNSRPGCRCGGRKRGKEDYLLPPSIPPCPKGRKERIRLQGAPESIPATQPSFSTLLIKAI